MSSLLALGLAVLVSVTLSTVLVQVLWRPLQSVLQHLCPSADASRFWVAFTAVMLYVAPLLFATFFPPLNSGVDLARVLRSTLMAALLGAFVSLLVVGYNIANSKVATKAG
jgi:hypothetical protein